MKHDIGGSELFFGSGWGFVVVFNLPDFHIKTDQATEQENPNSMENTHNETWG